MWRRKFAAISRLDGFEYFRNTETKSVENFVKDLLKLNPISNNVLAGIAFHKAIENIASGIFESNQVVDGWQINTDDLNVDLFIPQFREISVTGQIGDYVMYGRVDCIDHSIVYDLKTTKKFDAEKYLNSWQWKTYLWATGLDKFVYHVFDVDISEEEKLLTVKNYNSLTCHRYPNMNSEVESMIIEYYEMLDKLKPLIEQIASQHKITLERK